ncbi:MAG TPA: CorA family divalent cation transporter [Candidatus Bathyarchaeia archaeon]|nr:CorA family divalent cation transporter [Candidatus Bathyarchaeia archaeon]
MTSFTGESQDSVEPALAGRILVALSKCLNEPFMGFLALLALALTIAPSVFSGTYRFSNISIWIIVGVFILEYVANLLLAREKKSYVLSVWRLLDLMIILAPLLSLLPGVGTGLASSPVLRLIRVLRVGIFGIRAGGVVVHEQLPQQAVEVAGLPFVSVVPLDGKHPPRQTTWHEFQRWETGRENQWYHVSNISTKMFDELAHAAGIPLQFIETCLSDTNFPRIEAYRNATLLSVWLPSMRVTGQGLEVNRTSVLMVAGKNWLVTVSKPHCDLHNLMITELTSQPIPHAPFSIQIIVALLQMVLKRNEELISNLERRLRAFENVPIQRSRPEFFSQTFQMKKELSAAKSDLWRFKGILSSLAESRVHIEGAVEECSDLFRLLADQADYAYETVDNLREGILSVIELHLNVVSFDINRFMRVVAAVSALGLIPTIVGGLLGMNLVGAPWPLSLSQVAFCVGMTILACLYIMIVKRWLW